MTTQPTGGAPAAPTTATPATNVVDLDTARATSRTEALAYARTVTELCQLAGLPDRATAFIDAEASLDDVRKQLIDAKATNSATTETLNNQPPAGTPRFSLAANMRKRFGQKEG